MFDYYKEKIYRTEQGLRTSYTSCSLEPSKKAAQVSNCHINYPNKKVVSLI